MGVSTFLEGLAAGNTPTGAARAAGIARSTFMLWRDTDPAFAAAWRRARRAALDGLERSAWHRAVEGVEKDVGTAASWSARSASTRIA